MARDTFTASVQYDDFKGTCAADEADDNGPNRWLKDHGYAGSDDILVGIKMYAGEHHGQHQDPVSVEFMLVSLEGHPDMPSKIKATGDPVEVKRVSVDMPVTDFLGLFKRFDVAVSSKTGLGGPGILDGREIVWTED